ncbi:right-handed parallel beta-helix repeat-containing protein [Serratia odorifera]|uniref:right-handed parallel beta-helix repeat-containing protein n=1 Tax=Serratia odorifera TaxID=618 RepID=UPI001E37C431|nr:right-handed parallel beta-helix repeat-containing protein [Serratia odorifera]
MNSVFRRFCLTAVLLGQSAVVTSAAAKEVVWQAITFGQSSDVNFATNVLPKKVGINQVTDAHGHPFAAGVLRMPFSIESRGGKIGNSHDGLTYYYTYVPAQSNALLEADITVDQFGPETGALPAGQEGAGLLMRDIIGKPRLTRVQPGYEEFPAASNMVMNAIITQDKTDNKRVQMMLIDRHGVTQSWGNAGVKIRRQGYQPAIDLAKTPRLRLRLQRTNDGFVAAYAPYGSDNWVSQTVDDAQRVTVQDAQGYYVGFFAARNARITVHQARLTLSDARPAPAKPWVAARIPTRIEIASAPVSAGDDYLFQMRSNEDGVLTLSQDGKLVATQHGLQAGEMLSLRLALTSMSTRLNYHFVTRSGHNVSDSLVVDKKTYADAVNLYVSPHGSASNDGSRQKPLDFASAALALAPGGVLWLADGDYPQITIPATASGTPQQAKKLRPLGHHAVFHGINLQASYWDIQGISVTGKSFNIAGSHNHIDRVVVHHADDSGIWIASPEGIGRALWASHNLISNSQSYANQDPGMINADGFAVKMRVGEGNRLVACFAHDNIDDGFDLFNKIEDGPNGRVTIENSIALRNTNNGFKLGGEGLPVAHQVSNSLAMENGMDGFSDNFNPGQLRLNNNVAIDNRRFNYIFRPGPYSTPDRQGIFKGNVSLRSKPGKYPDVLNGNIADDNRFMLAEIK